MVDSSQEIEKPKYSREELESLDDEAVFVYQLEEILKSKVFWEYLGEKEPKNYRVWLSYHAEISRDFVNKLLGNRCSISLTKASSICSVMKLKLWQLTKPGFDFDEFFKQR